jgi:phosphoglycolate phosphatase
MRAIVFDLDGTLVETAPDLHLVLEEVMGELGSRAPPLPAVRAMVGDGARALLSRALTAEGIEVGADELDRLYTRFLERYTAEPCRASHVFDDVTEVLGRLAASGWRLGVCTNKPQAPTERLLEILGLDRHFAAVVGGDLLPVRKPDPRHLGEVFTRLGGAPERGLMVGDSRNDLEAARALSVPCILVSFGYTAVPAGELGADVTIDRFADLPAAVARLDEARRRAA